MASACMAPSCRVAGRGGREQAPMALVGRERPWRRRVKSGRPGWQDRSRRGVSCVARPGEVMDGGGVQRRRTRADWAGGRVSNVLPDRCCAAAAAAAAAVGGRWCATTRVGRQAGRGRRRAGGETAIIPSRPSVDVAGEAACTYIHTSSIQSAQEGGRAGSQTERGRAAKGGIRPWHVLRRSGGVMMKLPIRRRCGVDMALGNETKPELGVLAPGPWPAVEPSLARTCMCVCV